VAAAPATKQPSFGSALAIESHTSKPKPNTSQTQAKPTCACSVFVAGDCSTKGAATCGGFAAAGAWATADGCSFADGDAGGWLISVSSCR